jgi:hypothetical protein
MKIHIGIDPGLSGGIAFIPSTGTPWAEKMPETDRDLIELLRDSISLCEPKALIELVHSSPQMGVKSAFTFGEGYGRLQMALTALGVPYERIRPAVWQKAMGCLTKGDKNVSKRRAQELFPNLRITHATADALLIAEFNRRTHP